MNTASPFGQYAAAVAAIASLGILGAWVATAIGLFAPSDALNAAALIILGAIFGTGAGALVVANGAGRQATAANMRLDSINAPSGPVAAAIVEHKAVDAAVAAAEAEHTPPPGTPPGGTG